MTDSMFILIIWDLTLSMSTPSNPNKIDKTSARNTVISPLRYKLLYSVAVIYYPLKYAVYQRCELIPEYDHQPDEYHEHLWWGLEK